ncbi:helix-turn-helix domain-containing protein [Caulobacter sp. 602-1]|uniref:helix-turn-helix domain-containing protein n=1 Tax=unclassified Caulobacter TaxID=2648921 RepID=UPI000F62D25F|nr:helix-turn-helix transcriptional regulator [Caulobacter sp. 602-1]RRN62792.1 XRE family transcriptional regulator [Caulobacter sp. 602-1]
MTPDRQAKAKQRAKTFIRAWRKHRGMNLEQAIERLELEVGYPYSVAQLSRVERGETGYSQDVLEALAIIYRCEPADLIMRDPAAGDAIWSIWDQLQPVQRIQLVEIGQTLKKAG